MAEAEEEVLPMTEKASSRGADREIEYLAIFGTSAAEITTASPHAATRIRDPTGIVTATDSEGSLRCGRTRVTPPAA